MIVLNRRKDESILIGSTTTAHVELSEDDISGIRNERLNTLVDVAQRLLTSMGPIKVMIVRPSTLVAVGIEAPKSLRIDREEVAVERATREGN